MHLTEARLEKTLQCHFQVYIPLKIPLTHVRDTGKEIHYSLLCNSKISEIIQIFSIKGSNLSNAAESHENTN